MVIAPLIATAQDTLIAVTNGKLWGFMRQSGDTIIKPKYQQVNPFSEGLASAKFRGRWGFIDRQGKEITPFKYDPMYDGGKDYASYSLSEGKAAVRSGGKWGFIDKTGKEVIPLIYLEASNFYKRSAKVRTTQRELLINHSNQNLLIRPYDPGLMFMSDRAAVSLNKKYGFIDRTGREVVPLKYDNAWWYEEGFAVVTKGGKDSFINMQGKEVIPFKYEKIYSFSNGLAQVQEHTNGPWGFINYQGEIVIPLEYQNAFSFERGVALVKKGGAWGLIDTSGKQVTPFKYEEDGIEMLLMGQRFPGGLIALMHQGKYGYVDVKTGKEITPFKYERAWGFYADTAAVMLNGKWGRIDRDGKETFPK